MNVILLLDIDECATKPCPSAATCSTPRLNYYTCTCTQAGYFYNIKAKTCDLSKLNKYKYLFTDCPLGTDH